MAHEYERHPSAAYVLSSEHSDNPHQWSAMSSQGETRGLEEIWLALEKPSAAATDQKSRSASFLVPDTLERLFCYSIPDDMHALRTVPTNI